MRLFFNHVIVYTSVILQIARKISFVIVLNAGL